VKPKYEEKVFIECIESGGSLLDPPCDWHKDGWCGTQPPHECIYKLKLMKVKRS